MGAEHVPVRHREFEKYESMELVAAACPADEQTPPWFHRPSVLHLTVIDVAGCSAGDGARLSLLHDLGRAAVRGGANSGAAGTAALAALNQTTRLSVGRLDTGDAAGAGAHGAC